MNCENVRSYSTNVNDTLIALDNDYGDLIIADFNFDNKDDFAIKRNSGGNGGPEYDYFLQSSNNNFIKNSYLSDSLVFFPSEISKEKKCLMTLVHAGVCHMGKHIYHYDSMNKT